MVKIAQGPLADPQGRNRKVTSLQASPRATAEGSRMSSWSASGFTNKRANVKPCSATIQKVRLDGAYRPNLRSSRVSQRSMAAE